MEHYRLRRRVVYVAVTTNVSIVVKPEFRDRRPYNTVKTIPEAHACIIDTGKRL